MKFQLIISAIYSVAVIAAPYPGPSGSKELSANPSDDPWQTARYDDDEDFNREYEKSKKQSSFFKKLFRKKPAFYNTGSASDVEDDPYEGWTTQHAGRVFDDRMDALNAGSVNANAGVSGTRAKGMSAGSSSESDFSPADADAADAADVDPQVSQGGLYGDGGPKDEPMAQSMGNFGSMVNGVPQDSMQDLAPAAAMDSGFGGSSNNDIGSGGGFGGDSNF